MKGITRMGKIILIFSLILALAACSSGTPASQPKVQPSKESVELLNEVSALTLSLKYDEARKILEEKYDIIKDNDLGLNSYGFWEFRIYQNYDKAEELCKEAIELNPENPDHYSGLGLIYEEIGKYQDAIDAYEKAIKKTNTYEGLKLNPMLSIIYKNIADCYLGLENKEKAIEALEKSTENNPFSIEANALLHKLYVEAEEYEKAYEVWKNDNLIDDSEDHVYKGVLEWNKLYKDALENKSGNYHKEMADLYYQLVLYDEAAMEYEKALKEDDASGDIKVRLNEVSAFIDFRDELRTILDDYYRKRCINGIREEVTYYDKIKPAYEKIAVLFPESEKSSGSPSGWIDILNQEIEKRFKIKIRNIHANGSMLGLHFGRIIDSSDIHSSMWGHEIDLKVTTLKNMTSNGLDYWRTMEKGGVGGWGGSGSEIVRVIQNSENDMKLLTASIYNEEAKQDFLKQFGGEQEDTKEGEPLELYYSQKISIEFITKQMDEEIRKARDKGISESDLQRYLFDRLEKDFTVKTNIFVHESQHAIDSKFGIDASWTGENEYRPKVSQLAYGAMPFLSLNQFYSPTIGEEGIDTHNNANTRVFKDVVQYIYDNSDKFPQIDTKKNILSQVTKLSEDELKEIGIAIFEKNYSDEKYIGMQYWNLNKKERSWDDDFEKTIDLSTKKS